MTVEMELVGVRVDMPSNTPVLLLREQEGDRRLLSIMIGGPEAQAIAFALDGVETRDRTREATSITRMPNMPSGGR